MLDGLPHSETLVVAADPDAAITRAQAALPTYRTRRVTTVTGAPQLAVSRGHWREAGCLVFHTSFYLLLAGIVLGSAFSFTGHVDVVEGEAFTDTPIGYDVAIPGRFFDTGDHPGFTTRLEDFDVRYQPDGVTPADFRSTVTFLEGGQPTGEALVRVNDPRTTRA